MRLIGDGPEVTKRRDGWRVISGLGIRRYIRRATTPATTLTEVNYNSPWMKTASGRISKPC